MSNTVKLYVYELSKGMAKSFSAMLLGTPIDGIWHTSIVIFGYEYFYGKGGIQQCYPGQTIVGAPDEIIDLGETQIDFELFNEYLNTLKQTNFRGPEYHLFRYNCNTFTNELAQFLTGNTIPTYITDLPNQVLASPFGPVLQNYLETFEDALQIAQPFEDIQTCQSLQSSSVTHSTVSTTQTNIIARNIPIIHNNSDTQSNEHTHNNFPKSDTNKESSKDRHK